MSHHPKVGVPGDHVSFQPDEESKITYPHLVYTRDPAYVKHADNIKYFRKDKYEVKLIDRDPDSPVFDELANRPLCSHKASFVVDGLNHFVFDLYH